MIQHHADGGTTLTGSAIDLYRVAVIRSAIRMYANCGMIPTRGVRITDLMVEASQITGQTLKGKKDHQRAIVALDQWLTEAKTKELHVD